MISCHCDALIHLPGWPSSISTASAWAIMEQMGTINVINELSGNGIHHLENVMTIEEGIYALFNKLALWFKAMV